ncbi:hypothetical protein [Salinimicrobium terrae]|uniref:hypothetical protein n=1 Tax=Salinimicrobium terrae TaxID=470866 RepID=UPI000421219E|nr:hypothetical protein [Salinimicrobium terrae]
MKVFLPFQKDGNPYLEEIAVHSSSDFIYGDLNDYSKEFEIVNIHWPEALFGWLEPTQEDLVFLEKCILEWKKNSVLIYTKHDFTRIKGLTPNFKKLFTLIEENADVFVHLGEYSRQFYEERFPEAQHKIIYHPLYRSYFKIRSKEAARKELGINQDALVLIVPGKIRFNTERDLILTVFKGLKIKEKVLIATNMRSEIRYDFPGRVRLKKFINIRDVLVNRFKKKYQPPKYLFNYERLNYEEFGLRVAAADIVLVPRIDMLNSGNIFLGLTFSKVVVGPKTGNIDSQLTELGLPVFNPYSRKSVKIALLKAIQLKKENFKVKSDLINKYEPHNVAKELDKLFQNIIRSHEA